MDTNMRTPLGTGDSFGLQTLLTVHVKQKHVNKWNKNVPLRRSRKRATENPFALVINDELDKKFYAYVDHVSIIIMNKEHELIEYTVATPMTIASMIEYLLDHAVLDIFVGIMFSFPIPTKYLKIRSKKSSCITQTSL